MVIDVKIKVILTALFVLKVSQMAMRMSSGVTLVMTLLIVRVSSMKVRISLSITPKVVSSWH